MLRNSPIRTWCLAIFCGVLCLAASAESTETTTAKKPAKSRSATTKASAPKGKHARKKSKTAGSKKRGQKTIESERAQQIQEALVREHYLDGEPSGRWDDRTQAALRRYQADQGWQSKSVPDSRALIKLGLGPSHDHLINPESAMTTAPAAVDSKARNAPRAGDASKAPAKPAPAESGLPQR